MKTGANPATNSLIATRVEPGRRGGVTGVKQSGVTLGVFLSGAMLPVLERFWGWRGASLTFAVLFGLLALVVHLTLAPDQPSLASPTPRSASADLETRPRLDPFVWRLAGIVTSAADWSSKWCVRYTSIDNETLGCNEVR